MSTGKRITEAELEYVDIQFGGIRMNVFEDSPKSRNIEVSDLIQALRAERKDKAALIEAIEFYADPKKWMEFEVTSGDFFGAQEGDIGCAFDLSVENGHPGLKAQEALAKVRGEGVK